MSREWQQTKMQEYIMPNAVYYQSIWAVRDYERMIEQMKRLESKCDQAQGMSIVSDSANSYVIRRPSEDRALEIAVMKERVEGIKAALLKVPIEYRSCIISNIVNKNPGYTFPNKVWRMWKQRFLYDVAKNLSMI